VFARIGNEAGQTGIAAQMALCCGRLGEYCDQIHWSRIDSTELRDGLIACRHVLRGVRSSDAGGGQAGD
jgi:hypothetical protein